ncbi:unnamed protein product [Alopecurus aequalis]
MHAPVLRSRRRGFQPREEVTHFVTSDFALGKDHDMLLQGRGKSKTHQANSGHVLQGGGIRNSTVYSGTRTADVGSYSKGNFSAQTRENDVTVPMSAEAASLFSADGIGNVWDIICSQEGDTQDKQKNKGKDPFLLDWPELGGLENFDTDLRTFGSAFENYFDDPMWPSICSPDVQLVPSSHFDNDTNSSAVASKSANKPILESTVSVPDTTDQTSMANRISTQQPSKNNKGRENPPSNRSSSEEGIERFPRLSDSDIFFCPFDDMLVPVSPPSIPCSDEIVPSSSSTLPGPDDLVSAYVPRRSAKKKTHATTPDMILDEMAGNPLEMYFPPLTTYEQPEVVITGTSSSTQMQHHQLLPGGFTVEGSLNSSGQEFGPRGRRTPGGGVRENPRSSLVPEAAPAKHLGFQKLQEGMNQLDVGTKTCIRDALYRLANSVEQTHSVDQTHVGSSGAGNRLKKSIRVWTETQGSPMDRSVAQLLLQKPPYQKTTDRQQANRVA